MDIPAVADGLERRRRYALYGAAAASAVAVAVGVALGVEFGVAVLLLAASTVAVAIAARKGHELARTEIRASTPGPRNSCRRAATTRS